MTASEIRALFAVASRPEVVSLAGGMPNLAALPMDAVGDLAASLLRDHGTTSLQYGSGQGDPVLRERILDVMALEGIDAHADDVVVTTGSQQALDLVTRVFVDPGDVVVAEAPSYVGALGVFRAYQADVVHTPMDADGLDPDALEVTLTRLAAEGRTVKLLYTVPNHHNPGGVTLSRERRARVLEVAQRWDVLVLEDNPYGLLGFDEEPLPALRSLDAEGVVYLGSFSKTFAPGLRVGWALAPHAIRDKLVLASESAILCPSAFSQAVVARYLDLHDWRHQVKVYQQLYRERRDAMLAALDDLLPDASWTVPGGGFYVWVRLPGSLDAKAMLPRAVTERVAYVPGTAFYAGPTYGLEPTATGGAAQDPVDGGDGGVPGRSHVRLSYCYPDPERIREGVRRLAGVVDGELDVRRTFGAAAGSPSGGRPEVLSPGPETT
ncbi:aminotransferase-like domain-containing protein [Thalassiella azotivora]